MFPLYDENPRRSKPYINYALIITNFIVFIWEVVVTRSLFLNNREALQLMLNYGFVPAKFIASINDNTLDGFFSIFSSMFMHGSIMHIAGNMLFLWIFGDNIEDRFGHIKYLLIYLLWGIIATLTHFAWVVITDNNPLIPAVGASGAISGVLGAYMLIFPKARIVTLVFFFFITTTRIPAFAYLFMWFIYQIILAPFGGGVAYLAHIGGFVGGILIALIYKVIAKQRYITKGSSASYIPLVRPVRLEGIITNDYVEILADIPNIAIESVNTKVNDNILYLEAMSNDGSRRYSERILLRVDVEENPTSIDYINGILRLRFRRV